MNRIGIVIGLLLGLVFASLCFNGIIADGAFPLVVSIRSAAAKPIKKVTCCVCKSAEVARQESEEGITRYPSASQIAVADPFTGGPLTVHVPVSTHGGLFDSKYYQFRFLVVVAEYQDGSRTSEVVEIPDGRKTQSLTVTVP